MLPASIAMSKLRVPATRTGSEVLPGAGVVPNMSSMIWWLAQVVIDSVKLSASNVAPRIVVSRQGEFTIAWKQARQTI